MQAWCSNPFESSLRVRFADWVLFLFNGSSCHTVEKHALAQSCTGRYHVTLAGFEDRYDVLLVMPGQSAARFFMEIIRLLQMVIDQVVSGVEKLDCHTRWISSEDMGTFWLGERIQVMVHRYHQEDPCFASSASTLIMR